MKTDFPDNTEERLFSLVDEFGDEIHGEELGLLLYNGGTVCDDYFNYYSNSATLICKNMGYTEANMWASEGDLIRFEIQDNYEIKLNNVYCYTTAWSSCNFYEYANGCQHSKDVFLSCTFRVDDDDSTGFTSFFPSSYFFSEAKKVKEMV